MSSRPQRIRKPPVEIIKSLVKYKEVEEEDNNDENRSNASEEEEMDIEKPIKTKNVKSVSTKTKGRKSQQKPIEEEDSMDVELSNEVNEDSLWNELSRPNIAVKSVVTSVINRISSNDSSVVDQVKCDLVNLLFIACDSTHPQFTVDFIENNDASKCVEKTSAYTKKHEPDVDVVKKRVKNQKAYIEFWKKFIDACREKELLYEGENQSIISFLIEWLCHISTSDIAQYRITSAITAYEIMNGLIDTLKSRTNFLTTSKQQLNVDKTKAVAAKRHDTLTANLQLIERQIAQIKKMMNEIFEQYRDQLFAVREASLKHLGLWCKSFPTEFLKDQYLKYFGWSLYDKVAVVRHACVQSIISILSVKDNQEAMNTFCTRFLDRFAELCKDVDDDVAVAAVELNTIFLKLGFLRVGDLLFISSYLFDTNIRIRKAAGKFVYEDCFVEDDQVRDKPAQIMQLLNVMTDAAPQSPELDVAAYQLVESLWDQVPVLQDWNAMLKMLKISESTGKKNKSKGRVQDKEVPTLSDNHQTYLIYIIAACCQYCMPQASLDFLDPDLKKIESITADKIDKVNEFVEVFSEELVPLLTTYQADEQKLASLVNLPRYLDLAYYSSHRKNKAFEELLDILKVIYFKNSDSNILISIAYDLSVFIKSEEYSNDVSNYLKEVTSELSEIIINFNLEDTDDYATLSVAIKRLCILAARLELDLGNLDDVLLNIIDNQLNNEINDDLTSFTLELTYVSLLIQYSKQDFKNKNFNKAFVDNLEIFGAKLHLLLSKSEGSVLFKTIQVCADFSLAFNNKLKDSIQYELADVLPKELFTDLQFSFISCLSDLLESKGTENNILDTLIACAVKLASYNPINFKELTIFLLNNWVVVKDNNVWDELIRSLLSNMKKYSYKRFMEIMGESLIKFYEKPAVDTSALFEYSKKLANSFGSTCRDFHILANKVVHYAFTDIPKRFDILDLTLSTFIPKFSADDCNKVSYSITQARKALPIGREYNRNEDFSLLDDFQAKLSVRIKNDKSSGKTRAAVTPSKKRPEAPKSLESPVRTTSRLSAPALHVVSPLPPMRVIPSPASSTLKRKLPDIQESDDESKGEIEEIEEVDEKEIPFEPVKKPRTKVVKPSKFKPIEEEVSASDEEADIEDDEDLKKYTNFKKKNRWSLDKSKKAADEIED